MINWWSIFQAARGRTVPHPTLRLHKRENMAGRRVYGENRNYSNTQRLNANILDNYT